MLEDNTVAFPNNPTIEPTEADVKALLDCLPQASVFAAREASGVKLTVSQCHMILRNMEAVGLCYFHGKEWVAVGGELTR